MSYISENRKELFESSPDEIKNLIKGGEVKSATTSLGEKYKLPAGEYTGLANIISYILIGALLPENVVAALKETLEMNEADATSLAEDLEKGILEKARQIILGKPIEKVEKKEEINKLEYAGAKSPDELRKEIMDTTKAASALKIPQTSGVPKKPSNVTPGSRSQLLEQLQILSDIPNDEEIEERLKHIQDQLGSIKKQEETNTLESNIALKSFMFGEKGKETAQAVKKTATYSVAPTHYNLDPYRELAED